MARASDPAEVNCFRSERFYLSNGQWYFATREGVDFGPFTIRADGEKALSRYIDTQHTMRRLRQRDPGLDAERQWNDQSVARAAREVADWRLDRGGRPDAQYSDRSEKHK
jgi:hypothetical protein